MIQSYEIITALYRYFLDIFGEKELVSKRLTLIMSDCHDLLDETICIDFLSHRHGDGNSNIGLLTKL